jgi:hypothetical protein
LWRGERQERLTWDDVALHAGGLPGYPESHGCVQPEVVACATGPVSPPVVDLLHHRVLLGCGRVHRLGL